jgi:arylsulfatase A-like enzyme/tetratricopeptide (TPR) repeat protein
LLPGVAIAAVLVALGGAWFLARRPPRPNLLLVTIDTLRADHVGAYGASGAQTKHLDDVAAHGVRFEHAESAIPLTGPSHATILTGQYPPVHGVRDNIVFALDERHKTLAELLKEAGYRTGAFVGAYPVAAAFGFRQGFDVFHEDFKESPIPGAGAQRRANEVADDAMAWLSTGGKGPFFAWVHFYDPHAPYDPPEPFKTAFEGRPYDGEIAFTDVQLGRVLDALKAAGHGDDTVVAILSDHGESLGEHGEVTHAVLVYEATLHVPLLLAGPGVPAGAVAKPRVGTVDVVPTLLGLLGVAPPTGLPGRDLRAAFRGARLQAEALYGESLFGRLNCRWSSLRTLYDGDHKLIEGSRIELFDLATDPREEHDLSAREAPRVKRMRAMLKAAVSKMAPSGDEARTAAIAPDQEAILRSLGYAAGTGGSGALDDPTLPDPRDKVHLYERLQVIQRPQKITLAQALAEATAIVEEDPGNPFAYQTVASLAYRTGRLGLAVRFYRRCLELDPDRPAIRQNFGKLLRELGRLDESEKELRLAVEQSDASDMVTRASLVETLLGRGRTEEAGRLVAELVARSPRDAVVQAARGRWLIAVGQLDEAASLMEEASVLDADPLVEMASAWLQKGDAKRAQATAEEALKKIPGQPWATGVLGHALVAQGRRDAGLLALKQAVAARPKRPQAWLSLAAGFEAAQDTASAAACRRAARELSAS